MRRMMIGVLTAFAISLSGVACAPAEESDATEDELRAIREGVDIDESVIEDVPAGPNAPEPLADVRSWSVRYVELRDPTNKEKPDPVDPFIGFFLIAKDAKGVPLFFDTMSLTEGGIAHFYFSTKTDTDGNYVEIPLVAGKDDAKSQARAKATADWLTAEKVRVGGVIKAQQGADSTSSELRFGIAPLAYKEWRDRVKCAADLAVFALTLGNPVAEYVAQAVVDGTAALVDMKFGEDPTENAKSAALNAAKGGVRKVVDKYVKEETLKAVKTVGVVGVAVVATVIVGYQAYDKGIEAAAKFAAKEVVKRLVPTSCQDVYQEFTKVP